MIKDIYLAAIAIEGNQKTGGGFMKYCVLGMGRTGCAMVAYLSDKGQNVVVWDRKASKLGMIAKNGIKTSGSIEGVFYPEVHNDIAEAVYGSEYILVTTVAGAHKPIAKLLSGHLDCNQSIIIFNGNMGAYEFYSVLQKEAIEKKAVIAETGGMILIADFTDAGVCHIKSVKNEISFSAIPNTAARKLAQATKDVFPQFISVENVIETSLNNSNPVLHTPITLFNITRIENGEDYLFYDTAATRLTIAFAEKIDAERCKVIEAIGSKAQTCLEIINSFWPDKYDTLYDVIKNNKNYMSGKGPKSLDYRYLTEDLPYGIAPLSVLGKKYGVPTPCIDTMLNCFYYLLDKDYMKLAPDLTKTDITSHYIMGGEYSESGRNGND